MLGLAGVMAIDVSVTIGAAPPPPPPQAASNPARISRRAPAGPRRPQSPSPKTRCRMRALIVISLIKGGNSPPWPAKVPNDIPGPMVAQEYARKNRSVNSPLPCHEWVMGARLSQQIFRQGTLLALQFAFGRSV